MTMIQPTLLRILHGSANWIAWLHWHFISKKIHVHWSRRMDTITYLNWKVIRVIKIKRQHGMNRIRDIHLYLLIAWNLIILKLIILHILYTINVKIQNITLKFIMDIFSMTYWRWILPSIIFQCIHLLMVMWLPQVPVGDSKGWSPDLLGYQSLCQSGNVVGIASDDGSIGKTLK